VEPDQTMSVTDKPGGSGARAARPGGVQPPTIAGYVLHTPLGRGAYGEVWLGENRTTKRQVAVKFLRSRATLDWALLDGETEKLAFLAADRRVVQLLDVGRDADPPFFVMEYVSRGSLARHLETAGRLSLERTVATFEEIALGLMQVHAKGILHCDLKPSNILLDDELRPRLADFGQSRLREDRSAAPALGTMFFMAPEQADPAALPDARWDVYALGAVLYTMLEGRPPHQSDQAIAAIEAEPDLARRLGRYRQLVASAPVPLPSSRRLDRALRDILARSLAANPRERFSTVQEVVEALRRRREARGRRPMIVLGGLGPVLLLAVMIVFGVRGYTDATQQSADAIRRRAFESNRFAAASIARSFEADVRRYFDIVSAEAGRPELQEVLRQVAALPDLERLAALGPERTASSPDVQRFRATPARLALDTYLDHRLDAHLAEAHDDPSAPRFASIFVLDAEGTHLGAAYVDDDSTKSVGRYFGWRSYFHGGPEDLPHATPRARITPIAGPNLSAPYLSTTTGLWRVAVSTPLQRGGPGGRTLAGVLAFSVDIGNLWVVPGEEQGGRDRFPVLVDARGSRDGGRIMLHPYFADRRAETSEPAYLARPLIPDGLLLQMTQDWRLAYRDPFAREQGGAAYGGLWIAAAQPLRLPGTPAASPVAPDRLDGLVVLVQERSAAAIGPVVQLGRRLVTEGLLALGAIAVTVAALWFFALWSGPPRSERLELPDPALATGPRPLRERSTLSETSDG
jgi:hypothetical protein